MEARISSRYSRAPRSTLLNWYPHFHAHAYASVLLLQPSDILLLLLDRCANVSVEDLYSFVLLVRLRQAQDSCYFFCLLGLLLCLSGDQVDLLPFRQPDILINKHVCMQVTGVSTVVTGILEIHKASMDHDGRALRARVMKTLTRTPSGTVTGACVSLCTVVCHHHHHNYL